MNINKRTRTLVIASLLAAITFLFGLTPIGYIPLPTMKITILAIPVIIGVMMEGLSVGLLLGFVFGLTSLIQVFMGDPLGLFLMGLSPFRTILMIFIPRLLVPVFAHYTYTFIKNRKGVASKTAYSIGAAVGSLTNTVFFLGMLYLLFQPFLGEVAEAFGTTKELFMGVLGSIVLTNGLPELIVAVIIVTLVCVALERIVFKEKT